MSKWQKFGSKKRSRAILITGNGGYRIIDTEHVAIRTKSGGYKIVKGTIITR